MWINPSIHENSRKGVNTHCSANRIVYIICFLPYCHIVTTSIKNPLTEPFSDLIYTLTAFLLLIAATNVDIYLNYIIWMYKWGLRFPLLNNSDSIGKNKRQSCHRDLTNIEDFLHNLLFLVCSAFRCVHSVLHLFASLLEIQLQVQLFSSLHHQNQDFKTIFQLDHIQDFFKSMKTDVTSLYTFWGKEHSKAENVF